MKKKILSVLMAAALFVSLLPAASAADTVKLSTQNLAVNGQSVDCEKYNINGSNYFKLRDLACLLNGTGAQFAVGFDSSTNTVTITLGAAYTANGSELKTGVDKSSTARVSSQTIQVNGTAVSGISVYNIGGNNYFKLRDMGDAVGFAVGYDEATRTATVSSSAVGPVVTPALIGGTWEYDDYKGGMTFLSDGSCTIYWEAGGIVPGTWAIAAGEVNVYAHGVQYAALAFSGSSLIDNEGDTLSRVDAISFVPGSVVDDSVTAGMFVGTWEYIGYNIGYNLKSDGTCTLSMANSADRYGTWAFSGGKAVVTVEGAWYADLWFSNGRMVDDGGDAMTAVTNFSF